MRLLKLLTLSALASILVLANVCVASSTVKQDQMQHHSQKDQHLAQPSINCCDDFSHNQIEGVLNPSSKLEKKKTTHSNEFSFGTLPTNFKLFTQQSPKERSDFFNKPISYFRSVLSTTVRRE